MAGVGAKRSRPGGQVPCLIAHADSPHPRPPCAALRSQPDTAHAAPMTRFPDRLRPASTSSAAPHLWIGVVHPQDGTDARFTQPLAGEAALEYWEGGSGLEPALDAEVQARQGRVSREHEDGGLRRARRQVI